MSEAKQAAPAALPALQGAAAAPAPARRLLPRLSQAPSHPRHRQGNGVRQTRETLCVILLLCFAKGSTPGREQIRVTTTSVTEEDTAAPGVGLRFGHNAEPRWQDKPPMPGPASVPAAHCGVRLKAYSSHSEGLKACRQAKAVRRNSLAQASRCSAGPTSLVGFQETASPYQKPRPKGPRPGSARR